MINISVKDVETKENQYLLVLTDDLHTIPKGKRRKAKCVTGVYVVDQSYQCRTIGKDKKRMADAIDGLLDAYEEETEQKSRKLDIHIDVEIRGDVYKSFIDYLIATDYINQAKVNGVYIR